MIVWFDNDDLVVIVREKIFCEDLCSKLISKVGIDDDDVFLRI